MKQSELIRALRETAKDKKATLVLVRHGGKHDIYRIGDDGVEFAVPRHSEINELTARSILKEAAR